MDLATAIGVTVAALRANTPTPPNGNGEATDPVKLEVAVLDRQRPGRAFRRITGAALDALLPSVPSADEAKAAEGDAAGEGDSAKKE